MKCWVGLGGWLHTEINVRHRELNPDTVTHLSTNRVRRRLTSLIRRAIPLRQTATVVFNCSFYSINWTGNQVNRVTPLSLCPIPLLSPPCSGFNQSTGLEERCKLPVSFQCILVVKSGVIVAYGLLVALAFTRNTRNRYKKRGVLRYPSSKKWVVRYAYSYG